MNKTPICIISYLYFEILRLKCVMRNFIWLIGRFDWNYNLELKVLIKLFWINNINVILVMEITSELSKFGGIETKQIRYHNIVEQKISISIDSIHKSIHYTAENSGVYRKSIRKCILMRLNFTNSKPNL